MNKQVAATGFVLFSFLLLLKAAAATFTQMYVFGDSLSDTGTVIFGALVTGWKLRKKSQPVS